MPRRARKSRAKRKSRRRPLLDRRQFLTATCAGVASAAIVGLIGRLPTLLPERPVPTTFEAPTRLTLTATGNLVVAQSATAQGDVGGPTVIIV